MRSFLSPFRTSRRIEQRAKLLLQRAVERAQADLALLFLEPGDDRRFEVRTQKYLWIKGVVVGADDQPLSRARISARNVSSGGSRASAATWE